MTPPGVNVEFRERPNPSDGRRNASRIPGREEEAAGRRHMRGAEEWGQIVGKCVLCADMEVKGKCWNCKREGNKEMPQSNEGGIRSN